MNRKKSERLFTPIKSFSDLSEKLETFGDRTAFLYFNEKRELQTVSYGEFGKRIRTQAAGLEKCGLAGKRIAILGETSVEWVCSYISVIASGGVAIPMDRELDALQIEEFFAFAEVDAVIYSKSFNRKFAGLADRHATVTVQIPLTPEADSAASEAVLPYAKLMEIGASETNTYEFPKVLGSDRMVEMLFTSGTTGSSKCVMLCEKNVISVVNSACGSVDFSPEDTIVSVLPIHHTYELAIMIAALNYGMQVAINDSLKHVLKNFAFFKPTGLVLVPLFVSTMNKRIWDNAHKSGKEKALKALMKISKRLRKLGIDKRSVFFKQINAAFGGRLEKIICGGAALNPELASSFSEFGIDIYEGYGITECAPLIAVNPYTAPKRGSVGPAVSCCQVRIDSDHTNDKGYPEGEIQVKGDNVMLGYYKNAEATAEVFTQDGWFCTGDIGYMDADGYIFITGRKKYVIVLENGKNVFPEEIEEYLERLDCVGESMVLSRKDEKGEPILTAIVVPSKEYFSSLDDRTEVETEIRAQIARMNRKLVSYKQVRNVEFRYEPFERTTSRKIKRHTVQ